MSRSKAQFLNQFNQINPNIVKIKVNSIAQVLFAPTAASSLDLKSLYILSSASLGVWKSKQKNLKKKCCLIIWNTLYICCCINYETRILRHDSSSRLHHAASAFFYFFPSSFFSQFTIHNVLCSQCTEGQFCFFGTPCMFCRNLRTSKQQQQ